MPEEKETEIRFEAAVSEIEEIVESLERGEPALAEALAKYETGVRLLMQCYGLLERADRSVALLTGVDGQGNPKTAPFDATATIEHEAGSGASSTAGPGESRPILTQKPARARRVRPTTEEQPDPFEPPF